MGVHSSETSGREKGNTVGLVRWRVSVRVVSVYYAWQELNYNTSYFLFLLFKTFFTPMACFVHLYDIISFPHASSPQFTTLDVFSNVSFYFSALSCHS